MGRDSKGDSSRKTLIAQYFLEEENPYTKRRPIRSKNVVIASVVLLLLLIGGMVWLSIRDQKNKAPSVPSPVPPVASIPPATNAVQTSAGSPQPGSSKAGGFYGSFMGGSSGLSGIGGRGGATSNRNHSANQVIRRGAGSGEPGAALPVGYSISVRLLNSILSTDTTSPVIAEVTEDVFSHGVLSIPGGTRAIGAVRYDEASRRLQLRFQTLVYPEGDQHPVQAMGMMADGSAGLEGDYHSGAGSRQAGKFLTHFIGAMANGMKERQSGGPFGIPYEPGSLKNGILSGIALSADDEAQELSQSLKSTKPTMSLSAGQEFLLFFEQEYVP